MGRILILGLIFFTLSAGLASTYTARAQEPVNLLQNPGFEGDYFPWGGINEVQVAHGWTPWWRDRTENDPPATYFRPEYKRADVYVYDYRVRSGTAAQQWFTFHSTHEAGMYQQVMNVEPGKRYRFTIWCHVWSSTEHDPRQSVNPANPRLQVGIDPTGAWNPWGPTVVWSHQYYYIDTWGQLAVEAVAQSDVITVFMRSNPEFAVAHNDTYWDDAALINVDDQPPPPPPATATPPPAEPSATAPPAATATLPPDVTPSPSPVPTTPAPTATCAPPPEGWVPYSVQRGDTLFALAESRNTDVDEVMAANCLRSTDIFVGQELLLPPLPGETATAEPATPSSTAAPTNTSEPPSSSATATMSAEPATATASQPPPTSTEPATASATPANTPSAEATSTAAPSPTQAVAVATEAPQATSGATSPPAPSGSGGGSSGLWLGLLGLAITAGLVGLIVFGWKQWARGN